MVKFNKKAKLVFYIDFGLIRSKLCFTPIFSTGEMDTKSAKMFNTLINQGRKNKAGDGNVKTMALYDNTCQLCQMTKKSFGKLDLLHRVEWISLQKYEKEHGELIFSSKELRRELHIITPSQEVLKGFYAVRRLLLLFPLTFVFGLLLHFPLASAAGVPVYRWIARNRHKLLRKKCKDGSCTL
jgi:predicted DCC family thiol-disulfide oxidoreductase YuxK